MGGVDLLGGGRHRYQHDRRRFIVRAPMFIVGGLNSLGGRCRFRLNRWAIAIAAPANGLTLSVSVIAAPPVQQALPRSQIEPGGTSHPASAALAAAPGV
jgi:hypothetical protein